MLEVRDLHVVRGATHVLQGVSLEVCAGETAALLGANGAGKSTTLQTLSGLLRPRSGTAVFQGVDGPIDLARASPEAIVRQGLVQCPEGRQIFRSLTVTENLAMGAYARRDRASAGAAFAQVHALFPVLKERANALGGVLSGGEQMMLAIGRGLLAAPRLLLLDEPSLGLAPQMVERIFDVIETLKRGGATILLVEQNAAIALEIADRAYVLENGRVAISGSGQELAADDRVRQAYLGAPA
ncbi:MAG TPA: ABC transporter ATP-binding protein [Mesorhizobium sp.]|jgi:branched-chain amino acid transport system ATP-binding protein|nr:ABC transporter ATP-binding protein [Mesorhizobium sp.]